MDEHMNVLLSVVNQTCGVPADCGRPVAGYAHGFAPVLRFLVSVDSLTSWTHRQLGRAWTQAAHKPHTFTDGQL